MNRVQFGFENSYVTNSAGLHYYKDPKDAKVYIFSHLEPFFCHRFMPCFDQPDLRAPLSLTVTSPDKQWLVIANGKERNTDGTNWEFDTSPCVSPYIYALCAGDFAVIENKQECSVPMRLFCRHSKMADIDA